MNIERTNWRDQGLSARHRTWGDNLYASDLDFILCEYNWSICCAIIEYKSEFATKPNFSSSQYKSLINLGNRADCPLFSVIYSKDFSNYKITPLNDSAKLYFKNEIELNEEKFTKFHKYIREKELKRIRSETDESFIGFCGQKTCISTDN